MDQPRRVIEDICAIPVLVSKLKGKGREIDHDFQDNSRCIRLAALLMKYLRRLLFWDSRRLLFTIL